MTFDESARRAMDSLDTLVETHDAEMKKIRDWISWIDTSAVTRQWSAVGKGVYTGDDFGSFIAEVDGPPDLARIIASCVNQICSLQAYLGIREEPT